MLVARATSSPILSSMRRSTPGIGEAFQSSLAACTTARLLKSAFSCMAVVFRHRSATHSKSTLITRPRQAGSAYEFASRMEAVLHEWKHWARTIKRDAHALYLASRDPCVPWYAKALAWTVTLTRYPRLISFLISSPLSVAWTISSSCPLEFGWSSRLFRLLFWTNIGRWQMRHEISRSACLRRLRLLF